MPILSFDSLDAVPDGLREFAKDADGKITVNVVPEAKLSEFRDNNITVSKERDSFRDQLDVYKKIVGDSPEDFEKDLQDLRLTRDRVAQGDLKESRAVEEAVGKRTEEMRKKYDEELQTKGKETAAWRQRATEAENRYRESLVVQAVKDAANAPDSGVDPLATSDIAKRALGIFKVTDDYKLVPMNGDAPIYGSDGVSAMTPKEWLAKLKEEAPYFFKASQGGGSGGETTRKTLMGHTMKDLRAMTSAEKLAIANKEQTAKL
jgi:hypothetical protein